MPSAVRRYAGRPPISVPPKRMCPASGLSAPVTRLKNVVLPAPFGPMLDRRLRLLVMDAVERIEVAVRTQLSYHHARRHGPFAYGSDATSLPKLRESPSTASRGSLTA